MLYIIFKKKINIILTYIVINYRYKNLYCILKMILERVSKTGSV